MSNLGKLWFELGLRDNVTSELNKIQQKFEKLSGQIERNRMSVENFGRKPIKVNFDTSGVKEVEKVITSIEAKMESLKTRVNNVMVVSPKNQAEFNKLKAQADELYKVLDKLSKIPSTSTIGYGGADEFGAEGRRIAANKRREMEIREVIAQLEKQEQAERQAAKAAEQAARQAAAAQKQAARESRQLEKDTQRTVTAFQRLETSISRYNKLIQL